MSTPQATYKELREKLKNGIPCPSDFSFPSNVIDKWAADSRNLLAIHWVAHDYKTERKITYSDLADLTNRAAVVFSSLGITKGSRVLLQIPRVAEWWVAFFGLMRLGAIPIPGTALLVAKDLKFRASAAGAVAFIGDSISSNRFEEISKEVGISTIIQVRTDGDGGLGKGRIDLQASIDKIPKGTLCPTTIHRSDDLAIMFFTSGTTGMPKMVLLENEYTLGHVTTGSWYRLQPGKLFRSESDGGWAKGSWSTFGAFNMGAGLFVQPPAPGPFNPLSILASLHRYPITTLCCPPTIYRALCSTASLDYFRQNRPLALEHAVGAGEPLNPSVIRDWLAVSGITICDGFGQTETVLLAGNYYGEETRAGSMGKASPGITLGILGPNGVLPLGEEGELCVRSDLGGGKTWLFKGYLRDGKLDERRVERNGEVWYSTGDRAFEDADGYIWFVGRDDDVISSSGYRIGPFEVESALKEHPAVAESAAVASPDASRGEIVKAFIILTPEYEQRIAGNAAEEAKLIVEIQEHCKVFTAPFKYPRAIEFIKDLPKTVSGKIRRVELRNAEYEKKADVVKLLKSKL